MRSREFKLIGFMVAGGRSQMTRSRRRGCHSAIQSDQCCTFSLLLFVPSKES